MLNIESDYTKANAQNAVNPVACFSNTFNLSKNNITGLVEVTLSNSYMATFNSESITNRKRNKKHYYWIMPEKELVFNYAVANFTLA
jgi:hypothetical protein